MSVSLQKNGDLVKISNNNSYKFAFHTTQGNYHSVAKIDGINVSGILFFSASRGEDKTSGSFAFNLSAPEGSSIVHCNQLGVNNAKWISKIAFYYLNGIWHLYLDLSTNFDIELGLYNLVGCSNVVFSDIYVETPPAGAKETVLQTSGIIADNAKTVDNDVFINHQIVKSYNVSTTEELEAAINDSYTSASNFSFFEFLIAFKVTSLGFHGGTWYFKGFKGDNNYGYVEGRFYMTYNEKVRRFKSEGVWSDWISDSFSCHSVTNYKYILTEEELTSFLNDIYISSHDHSYYKGELRVNAGSLSITGGTWYVSGYRVTNEYGYQEIKQYASSGISYYARSRNNGVWGTWKNMAPS